MKILGGAGGLAVAVWLAYATVMGGFLDLTLHTKSNVDLCASGEVQLIQMQGNNPRDFAAEKALQDKVDTQCKTATKEAKIVGGMLPH